MTDNTLWYDSSCFLFFYNYFAVHGSFDDYYDKYHSQHYSDILDPDLPKYTYRNVPAFDLGLTAEEVRF